MSEPPYMRRKRIGEAGRKAERLTAKRQGGRLRPASGAMLGAKGDIELGSVLMESKSTTAYSLSIKHEWLAKIAYEARSEGKTPAVAITFTNEDGRPSVDGAWVLVPEREWREKLKEE